jgi:hypothetical protein
MVGIVTPAYELVHPSFVHPEVIMPINQVSGAFSLLSGGDPEVRIGTDDLAVYIKVLDIRTKETVSQTRGNQQQSVSIAAKMISTPTWMVSIGADYDMQDTAAATNWGFGLPEALRLGMRQGTFQQMRNAELFGVNPANGEGLANTVGATATFLPPDQWGKDTSTEYDNGEMAFFLAQVVQSIKTRTMQLGQGRRIVICGPQRTLGQFEYNIVQLVQAQRKGAGSMSTKGTLMEILSDNLDALEWVYDDTLQGKGSGSSSNNDLVIVCMPEVEQPTRASFNTNEFAGLQPNMRANTIMLCDMAAPREIISPIAKGGTDVLTQIRTTSGWGVRPEAITLVTMPYQ